MTSADTLKYLNGSWRLIFTTGTIDTQKKIGRKINYFPIKAAQSFFTETMTLSNGIYLGNFEILKFFGDFEWWVSLHFLLFIFLYFLTYFYHIFQFCFDSCIFLYKCSFFWPYLNFYIYIWFPKYFVSIFMNLFVGNFLLFLYIYYFCYFYFLSLFLSLFTTFFIFVHFFSFLGKIKHVKSNLILMQFVF